jgi:hypothetical protein
MQTETVKKVAAWGIIRKRGWSNEGVTGVGYFWDEGWGGGGTRLFITIMSN